VSINWRIVRLEYVDTERYRLAGPESVKGWIQVWRFLGGNVLQYGPCASPPVIPRRQV
jgi:hypothetical protein